MSQAEHDLVSVILADPDQFHEVREIHPGMFTNPIYQSIWRVIYDNDGAVATTALYNNLMESPYATRIAEQFPDAKALVELVIAGKTAGSAKHLAETIKESSVEASVENAFRDFSHGPGSAMERALAMSNRIRDAANRVMPYVDERRDYVDDVIRAFEWRQANPGKLIGLKTQWDQYNTWLVNSAGLDGGKLVVTFAFSNTGKTHWLIDFAINAAQTPRDDTGEIPRVRFYSLEMGPHEIISRALARTAEVNLLKSTGDPNAVKKVMKAGERVTELRKNGYFVNVHNLYDVDSICRDIYRARNEGRCDVAIIDYLGLVQSGGGSNRSTRYDQVGGVAEALQGLTQELQIPVVTAAQLNRGTLDNPGRRPDIGNIADSMRIYYASDVVHMMYRPELALAGKDIGLWKNIAVLSTPKVRNGMCPNPMYFMFAPEFSRFTDVPPEQRKMLTSEEQQQIARGGK